LRLRSALALTTVLAVTSAYAEEDDPPDPQVDVRLVHDTPHSALALVFDIEPGWHIYWLNPGDTGMATTATLTPALDEARFPGPERFVDAETEFVTYGYAGRTALFFELPSAGTEGLTFNASAKWLACRERCVFQTAEVALSGASEAGELDALRARLPRSVEPAIALDGTTARVTLSGGPFELFPPAPLEARLAAFRSTEVGVDFDLTRGAAQAVHVVLKRKDGVFVQFVLPVPGPVEE
jgi:thiol:disulfide interchange protein DsbD